MIKEIFDSLLILVEEMAPYLLLGFFIAGILHAFVPRKMYRSYLGGNTVKAVVLSVLFGIPLPLCSCGVIPTAVGMRKDGASKGATTAFLIATPQTGVDSILATWSVLGLPFAILRPIVALVTGLFGGLATNIAVSKEPMTDCEEGSADEQTCDFSQLSFAERCRIAMQYGFTDMLMDIGRWLVIGLLLAALITVFVPNDFFVSYQGNYLLNMLLVLAIACPMYVCATGSIPVAAALMMKGLSPGAALVFLMAGPATNMASMMILGKTLGRRSLMIYLASIILGAVGFGILTDALLPREWFVAATHSMLHSACCHEESMPTTWWQDLSTILLSLLLLRALWLRFHKKEASPAVVEAQRQHFKIDGMMCNHCRNHVIEAIKSVEGVTSVDVSLAAGTAIVEGTMPRRAVIEAVKKCGYSCE